MGTRRTMMPDETEWKRQFLLHLDTMRKLSERYHQSVEDQVIKDGQEARHSHLAAVAATINAVLFLFERELNMIKQSGGPTLGNAVREELDDIGLNFDLLRSAEETDDEYRERLIRRATTGKS
jgi:hypothetical protein